MNSEKNKISMEEKKELFSIITDEIKQKGKGSIVFDNINGKLDFHKFGVPIHYSVDITPNDGELYKVEVNIKSGDYGVGPFADVLNKNQITDTLFEYINLTKKEIQWYDELFMEAVENSGKSYPVHQ